MLKLKKLHSVAILLCMMLSLQSCFKHRQQIRIKNTFSSPVNVVVGTVDFGSVATGKTTAYEDIPKGHSEITGDITGSIDVPNGKHLYTLWINSSGKASLVEDSK